MVFLKVTFRLSLVRCTMTLSTLKLRDTAFMIFYMGINVGAFFAPFAANGIRTWWLKTNGFAHDANLPSLCHQYLNGTIKDISVFRQLADKVNMSGHVADLFLLLIPILMCFKGINYAFGIAAFAMVISLLVYVIFNKLLPDKEVKTSSTPAERIDFKPAPIIAAAVAITLTAFALHFIKQVGWASGFAFGLFAGFMTWIIMSSRKEERARITALVLVFLSLYSSGCHFIRTG